MAQAQLSKANRRREMECAVCLNRLRQPKMLMCSHNYCRDCLETLIQDQKISCPLCRVETALGAGGVDDLAKNISLMNIIDTVCVNCYNDREVLCEFCGKWMCSQCRASCKNKQKFTQDSTNLRKELAQAKKELTDTRSKLAHNVESTIDQIETRVRDIVNNAKLKGEHLKNEVRQEQNRQLDTLDKLNGELTDLDKTILRTTDEDSLKDKDMLQEAFENYTRQWSGTLTRCTEEISQAYRLIEFMAGKELPSVGKVSLKPDYKSAKIETYIFGSKGSAPGQFDCPKRVTFSPVTKNIIVLDNGNNRVQVFNERHELLLEFGSKGDVEGQFNIDQSACGLAVTDDGLIVVADTYNHRLQVFTERGKYVRSIGSKGSSPGEFCWCQGLDIHDDVIYVCDHGNYRVQVFEIGGKFVRQFGSRDVFTPVFPADVTVCPNKDVVVVAAQSNHSDDCKLVVFTADGKHKTTISNITGDSNSVKLHWPFGVTTNNAGHIIVSDYETDNIHIMTDCGKLLRTVGSLGVGPGELCGPIGLVCTEEGDIVVADTFNHRIQVFSFK